ncbi:MAG: hypothetical protein WDO70_00880 [Alphaproteobacteria bacterium]
MKTQMINPLDIQAKQGQDAAEKSAQRAWDGFVEFAFKRGLDIAGSSGALQDALRYDLASGWSGQTAAGAAQATDVMTRNHAFLTDPDYGAARLALDEYLMATQREIDIPDFIDAPEPAPRRGVKLQAPELNLGD